MRKVNSKPPLCFYQENHMDRQHEVTDNIVPNDGTLRLDDTQHAAKGDFRIFRILMLFMIWLN